MALNVEDVKVVATEVQTSVTKVQGSVTKVQDVVSELQVDIHYLVTEAQSKPKEAKKIFGIDKMTEAERKAALRKTTLVCFRVLDIFQTSFSSSYRISRSLRKTKILSSFD